MCLLRSTHPQTVTWGLARMGLKYLEFSKLLLIFSELCEHLPGKWNDLWDVIGVLLSIPWVFVYANVILLSPLWCVDPGKHKTLQWRHNGCDGVSNHQPQECLINRLFKRRSKKTSKLRATGLCTGNSPMTGEFPAQMVSNAENVSIW